MITIPVNFVRCKPPLTDINGYFDKNQFTNCVKNSKVKIINPLPRTMNRKIILRLGAHLHTITFNSAAYLCFSIRIGHMGNNLSLGQYAANIPLGRGGQCSSVVWVLYTFNCKLCIIEKVQPR